jgi:pimeloyl-ACP methyl ester carboxylesterase
VTPARLALLRAVFGVVQSISSALAASGAFHLFLRTFRRPLRTEDAVVLARARHIQLNVAGHAVAAYEWAGTGPTAIIVHGWGSSAARFTLLAQALVGQGWRVIAFDAPGHGASAGKSSSLPQFIAALDAVIAQLGAPQALIGHSLGALAIACRFKGAVPPWAEQLRSVTLISMPTGAEFLVETFVHALGLSAATERRLRARFHDRFHADPNDYTTVPGALNIRARLLLVHDRGDDIVPFGHSAELHQQLPAAQFIATEGQGHSMLTRDAATIARIVEFIT